MIRGLSWKGMSQGEWFRADITRTLFQVSGNRGSRLSVSASGVKFLSSWSWTLWTLFVGVRFEGTSSGNESGKCGTPTGRGGVGRVGMMSPIGSRPTIPSGCSTCDVLIPRSSDGLITLSSRMTAQGVTSLRANDTEQHFINSAPLTKCQVLVGRDEAVDEGGIRGTDSPVRTRTVVTLTASKTQGYLSSLIVRSGRERSMLGTKYEETTPLISPCPFHARENITRT